MQHVRQRSPPSPLNKVFFFIHPVVFRDLEILVELSSSRGPRHLLNTFYVVTSMNLSASLDTIERNNTLKKPVGI